MFCPSCRRAIDAEQPPELDEYRVVVANYSGGFASEAIFAGE